LNKLKYLLIILISILSSSIVYGENLNLSSQSSILMESKSGRILFENNAYKKLPMASTTKIMTALIALERGRLDDDVQVHIDSVGVEGSSIYLKDKEVMKLEDLLYGLMLQSGNDAAVAIAIHIGGTVEEFVAYMNKRAEELGAINTNFTNPHGLHCSNHYTTAYDLALISREALANEDFAKIVNTKSYSSKRDENNYFYNKNKTLWDYMGGDGVKIGYTMSSGRCLVSSATRNNMKIIAVSLNGQDWFRDNYKLLDYGFENFKMYLLYDKGQFVEKIALGEGDRQFADLLTEECLYYPLKDGERENIKISTDIPKTLKLPIDEGEKVGSISTYLNGRLLARDNLTSKYPIRKTNIIVRLFQKIRGK